MPLTHVQLARCKQLYREQSTSLHYCKTLVKLHCSSQTKLYIYVPNPLFIVLSYRRFLHSKGFIDTSLCVYKDSDGTVYLPLLKASLSQVDLQFLRSSAAADPVCEIVSSKVGRTWFSLNLVSCVTLIYFKIDPLSMSFPFNYSNLQINSLASNACMFQFPLQVKKQGCRTNTNKLEKTLQELLESCGEGWTEELRGDLPHHFQKHGDLILLGENCFTLPLWKKCGTLLKLFQLTLRYYFAVDIHLDDNLWVFGALLF